MVFARKEPNVLITTQKSLSSKIFMALRSYSSNYQKTSLNIIFAIIVLKSAIKSANALKELRFSQKMYLNVGFVEMYILLLMIVIIKID